MILEIYISFKSIGIDEAKAKRAAEAIVMAIEQRCELNDQVRLANTECSQTQLARTVSEHNKRTL